MPDRAMTNELVVKMAKDVTESAVADGKDAAAALMYFRDDVQLAVTMHRDPLAALKFAAPLCAAAWMADTVYLVCSTLVIALDTTDMTQDEVEKWLSESSLMERWERGEREGITESITINCFTPNNEEPWSTTMSFERQPDLTTVWGESMEVRDRGQGNLPDLGDHIFDEDVRTKFNESFTRAMDEETEKSAKEIEARRLAYPIMALAENGLLVAGALMGADPEVGQLANQIVTELRQMSTSMTIDDSDTPVGW